MAALQPFMNPKLSSMKTVVMSVSADAASEVLDSWSKNIVPLSDQDRLQLSSLAAEYANRLKAAQTDLSSRYGADFLTTLSTLPSTSLRVGIAGAPASSPSPAAPPAGNASPPENNAWCCRMLDAYASLLDLESYQRQSMSSVLPDRAAEIRNAAPYVSLFGSSK